LFDATTFKDDLIAKLEAADQTTEAEAMLAAIEDGDCVLEEGEPSVRLPNSPQRYNQLPTMIFDLFHKKKSCNCMRLP